MVLAAVSNKGLIFKYASKRLRADKEVAKAAVMQNKKALDYISDDNVRQEILAELEAADAKNRIK